MAYRFEKEQNGEIALVIDGFDKGIAPDPYSGMNKLNTVDLETPGEVAIGYPFTSNETSGASLGNPIAKSVRYFPTYATPTGGTGAAQSYAILDASGRVWESTSITGTYTFLSSSNLTTSSSANDGVVYWLGYLFKTRGTDIDYWNGSTWATGWQTTLTSGVPHFMYVATNNQLYITNGDSIARIFAPTPASFDPTNTGTFTFNAAILDIPTQDTAISLCEVGGGNSSGSTLLIGGALNAIYPWDKLSTSFNLPIYVADPYIKKMISVNQNAFIFPGNTAGRGRIYITNGAQAELFYKIPDYLSGQQDPYIIWGDAMFHRNNLVFGAYFSPNSGSGNILTNQLWAINLDTKAFRGITELPSNGNNPTNAKVLIPATNPSTSGFSYIFASENSTNYVIGYSGTTAGVGSGYQGIIITDRMPVGTFTQKKTFSQIEYKLRTPLQSGESITVYPVTEAGAQTSLSFSPTSASEEISGYAPVTFQANQWLQFEIRLVGNSATSGARLRELRIK